MTIHLPQDLESSLQTAVHSGHFASMDEAIAEAARLLLRELKLGHPAPPPVRDDNPPDPVLGCMREDAELMDEIVADAYRHRRSADKVSGTYFGYTDARKSFFDS